MFKVYGDTILRSTRVDLGMLNCFISDVNISNICICLSHYGYLLFHILAPLSLYNTVVVDVKYFTYLFT